MRGRLHSIQQPLGQQPGLTGPQRHLPAVPRDLHHAHFPWRRTRPPGRCFHHQQTTPRFHQGRLGLQLKRQRLAGPVPEQRATITGHIVHQGTLEHRFGQVPLAVLDAGTVAGGLSTRRHQPPQGQCRTPPRFATPVGHSPVSRESQQLHSLASGNGRFAEFFSAGSQKQRGAFWYNPPNFLALRMSP